MFLNKIALFPWKHNKTTSVVAEQTMDDEAINLELDLLPCFICGRTFLPAPLAKHTKACEKNATRKRKVFDSLKQRVEGTDLAPFHQKSYLKKADAPQKIEIRQSKWKEKHLELVNAIRAAKGNGSSLHIPPTMGKRSSTTLGTHAHERCPSCDRQFGPKAFDRHVEWCKEKRTTIHKSPASVVLAKERLEARTKYKVPPLTKSRRALTREKYSPQTVARCEAVVSVKSVSSCTLDRSPSVRRSKKIVNSKKSVDKMADSGGSDHFAERIVKNKLEKSAGDVKGVQSEKNLPKEVRKSLEPIKSTANNNKRLLLFSNINTISVNDDVSGLTVSQLSLGGDTRKLVTWKDTVMEKASNALSPIAFRGGNSPLRGQNCYASSATNNEPLGNIVVQSKPTKENNCSIKVVVKDKKLKKDRGGDEKVKSGRPGSKKSSPVKKQVVNNRNNVSTTVRSSSGQRRQSGNKAKSSTISLKVDMTDLYPQRDESPKVEALIPMIPVEVQDSRTGLLLSESMFQIPQNNDDYAFKDSDDAIVYDEQFNVDNYKDELTTFRELLCSIESNPLNTGLGDYFQEGVMCPATAVRAMASTSCDGIRNSRKSSANRAQRSSRQKLHGSKTLPPSPDRTQQSKNNQRSTTNSRRSSPKKSQQKFTKTAQNHNLKSCSDAVLTKVSSPRSKLPLASPRSMTVTPRCTPRRCPIDAARQNKSSMIRNVSPTTLAIQRRKGKSHWYKWHKSHPTSKIASPKHDDDIFADASSEKIGDDTIETQYQKCKALYNERKIEKVNSGDVGISCLTKFRRDTKIATCRRFLEKNQLVQVDLKSPNGSSEDTDSNQVAERIQSKDQCCQTPSIEGLTKTTIDQDDLTREYVPSFRNNEEVANGAPVESDQICEGKNHAYFDSLDGSCSSSVNSAMFRDENASTDTKIKEEPEKLKEKASKSNMLYIRYTEDCFSEDSVIDGCENYHSHALSVARIERGLRRCSSDVCLRKQSETSFMTYTETDLLRKMSSYECTSIRTVCEEANLTSDEILEIAGEQFLQSLRNSSTIKTSTPISGQKKPRSPNGEVPLKRRRLEEVEDGLDKSLENVYAVELRSNIQQIREAKMRLQKTQAEESVENSPLSKSSSRNSGILDDVVSQVQVDGFSDKGDKDGVEMKRILSTIEEASSNTSSGVANLPSRNREDAKRSFYEENRIASDSGDASKTDWVKREDNLIDLEDDSQEIPNGFRYMACHYEVLEPERVSPPPIKKKSSTPQTKTQSKYPLTRRPDSADVFPNLSPRFLHLIRTIIHPQTGFPVGAAKHDAEEEFLKISRAHCRKLLQLDKRKLNHILESEPLRLPQITAVNTVRDSTKRSKKVIKLPSIDVCSPCSSATRCVAKSCAPMLGSAQGNLGPLVLKTDSGKYSRIPVGLVKGFKAKSNPTSESSILERSIVVLGGKNRLPSRPNSLHTNTNTKLNPPTTLADNIINNNKCNTNNNNQNEYNPFILAERQLMKLLECDDFKDNPTAPPPTVQNTPRPRTTDNTTPVKIDSNKSPYLKKKLKSAEPKLQSSAQKARQTNAVQKRASVIDPPVDFRDRLSMLNDDFDAIESMINSTYTADETESNELSESFKFYSRAENNSFNLNAILRQRKYSDDLSSIDPRLINENDNLSIPESLHDDSSPASTLDNNFFDLGNRLEEVDNFSEQFDGKMLSIEPDGTEIKLKQSISMFDDRKILESGNIDEFVIALSDSKIENIKSKKSTDKNTSKIKKQTKPISKLPKSIEKSNQSSDHSSFGYSVSAKDKKKNNLASLKRSISLLDPVQKPKSLKNKQDVQNYFNEQQLRSPTKSDRAKQEVSVSSKAAEEEISMFVPKAEELFSVDDEMYEEYKKYEEMYLKEKEEKMKKEERRISDGQSGLLTASEDDDNQQQNVKLSGDSAYGSLNRKTPKVRARSTKLTPLDSQRNLAIDSPSSSSSESSPPAQLTLSTAPKMSKFCHECGNSYPLTSAKFCVECGVKRLVL